MSDFSAAKVEQSVKDSLKRLQLDYVDIIQVRKPLNVRIFSFFFPKKNIPKWYAMLSNPFLKVNELQALTIHIIHRRK